MEELIKFVESFLYSTDKRELLLSLIDAIIFLFFAFAVLYLLYFAIKGVKKNTNNYPKAKKKYRYVIVFSAYKADKVIIDSVEKIFGQDYPRENYDVVVVSYGMTESTDAILRSLSAIVVNPDTHLNNKADFLREATAYIDGNDLNYDNAVLLDADNAVDSDFLNKINDAFYSGCSVVQMHRVAKSYNNNIAVLDAVSEEMNNSIFRKGQTRIGFSSGLIGSGIIIDYELLKRYLSKSSHADIDKQLELFLLKRNYYIEYLQDVYVYDEKIARSREFRNQRRSWISTQLHQLVVGVWSVPKAAFEGNWDYCNKLVQWSLPPRVILLGMIVIIAVLLTLIGSTWAIKWWGLLLAFIIVLALSIPDYLFNVKLAKAVFSIPLLFLSMLFNTFIGIFSRNKNVDIIK